MLAVPRVVIGIPVVLCRRFRAGRAVQAKASHQAVHHLQGGLRELPDFHGREL